MKNRGAKTVFMVAIFLAGIIVLSAAVMILWNLLIPSIFGLGVINFWQALGLFILIRILFVGLGKGGMMRSPFHNKNHMHKKWAKMSDEQRKEFINKRRQSGFGYPHDNEYFRRPPYKEYFDMDKHEGQGNGD